MVPPDLSLLRDRLLGYRREHVQVTGLRLNYPTRTYPPTTPATCREAQEVVHFARAVENQSSSNIAPDAITVPFATLPTNVFLRLSAQMQRIAEPRVPFLRQAYEDGNLVYLNQLIALLCPPVANWVMGPWRPFTLRNPISGESGQSSRTLSARYVTDVECDTHWSNRHAALLTAAMVHSVFNEIESLRRSAWARVREGMTPSGRSVTGLLESEYLELGQYRPFQLYLKRDAFMLEAFGGVMSCGMIVDGRESRWRHDHGFGDLIHSQRGNHGPLPVRRDQ